MLIMSKISAILHCTGVNYFPENWYQYIGGFLELS